MRRDVELDRLGYDEVWAAAGTPRDVFPLAPTDLVRATAGSVAALSSEPPATAG